MSKPLFENVGKDIKSFAQSVAAWIYGMHILLGIVIFFLGCASQQPVFIIITCALAIGIIVFGRLTSKALVILLYAYGEMAERLISIDCKLSDSKQATKKVPIKKVDDTTSPKRTAPWRCAFCDFENPADVKYCRSCNREDIDA